MEKGRMKGRKRNLDKVIGTNIKSERRLREVSREELAEILGLTISHIGLIERGERGATNVVLEKFAKSFNISIDSLFQEPEGFVCTHTVPDIDEEDDTYKKKVYALTSQFTEQEFELLTYTITGILDMRKE